MAIVYHPLPYISKLFPLIGHVGVGDVYGVIHDFSSSWGLRFKQSAIDNYAFGETHKYIALRLPGVTQEEFMDAMNEADGDY